MTAAWRSRRRPAARARPDPGWEPCPCQRITTRGLHRMEVSVRESTWKMVGANTVRNTHTHTHTHTHRHTHSCKDSRIPIRGCACHGTRRVSVHTFLPLCCVTSIRRGRTGNTSDRISVFTVCGLFCGRGCSGYQQHCLKGVHVGVCRLRFQL